MVAYKFNLYPPDADANMQILAYRYAFAQKRRHSVSAVHLSSAFPVHASTPAILHRSTPITLQHLYEKNCSHRTY